jgi:HK97 gp10 family phage protein
MAADFAITGGDELLAQLQDLPAKIERNVMRGALRAGAKMIADEAKQLCPVGTDVPKGHVQGALRDSIRVSVKVSGGLITASVKAGNAQAFYAHMVEFGTARHFIKPKNRKSLFVAGLLRESVDHPGAKKKPFMRPAADGAASQAVDAIVQYLQNRIPNELNKVGKS